MKVRNHRKRRFGQTEYIESAQNIVRMADGAAVVGFERDLKSGNCVVAIFHQENEPRRSHGLKR
jgi:hypothetical protein